MTLRFSMTFFFITLLLSLSSVLSSSPEKIKKSYIVLVDPKSRPHPFSFHFNWYSSLISSSPSSILHIYETLIHGFSATLTVTQSLQIKNSHGILNVVPDSVLHPHTTRSPSFLGLDLPSSRLSAVSRSGSAAVIGVIDTGIWPEHASFSDRGLGPVPGRWRGECEEGVRFNRSSCNRKLIGARSFSAGYVASFRPSRSHAIEFSSARDSDGHGTHVASIAAGAPVTGAEFQGFAGGVSRGMAPKARIAAYKVCWALGCLMSDVVAALEKAVSDGVDILSVSLGSSSPAPFYSLDPFAIATFRASLMGVFVAASAGNGGPYPGTIANAPPWITTVGAGTIDRDFPAFVLLGNGKRIPGESISLLPKGNKPNIHKPSYPLLSAGKITYTVNLNITAQTIKGRIVLFTAGRHVSRIDIGGVLKRAGAFGMVVCNGDLDPKGIIAEPHVIRAIAVGIPEARSIEEYILSRKHPTATIFSEGTELLPDGSAPLVASFSSRGPNVAVPWVLKPDLLAPGVNILGAWTGAVSPSGIEPDIRRSRFNVLSGTSMACPHVSGVAALLRAAQPGWGPWEIKSALMTTSVTSSIVDESGGAACAFAMGAGHLAPDRALEPGLVYDLGYEDYMGFLCGLNYTDKEIRAVSGRGGISCESLERKGRFDLNYPAFVVEEEEVVGKGEVVFHRRLKRVSGGEGGWYRAEVVVPEGYKGVVKPERLWFDGRVGERLEFRLMLRRIAAAYKNTSGGINNKSSRNGKKKKKRDWWVGGVLTWRDDGGRYNVSSPIVVFSNKSLWSSNAHA